MSSMLARLSKKWTSSPTGKNLEKMDSVLTVPGIQLLPSQHLVNIHQMNSLSLQPSSNTTRPHRHHSQKTEEDEAWLKWIEERTGGMAMEAHVQLETFKEILCIEQAFFAERLFKIFDLHQRGYITIHQLLSQLSILTKACACRKLKLFFDVHDSDGNGYIDRQEFSAILSYAIDENALAIGPQQIEYMTQMLFESVNCGQTDKVSFDELKNMFETSPEFISTLQISASRFLRPPVTKGPVAPIKKKRSKLCPPYFLSPNYIKKHPSEFAWGVVYAISIMAFYLYGSLYAVSGQHTISTERCLPFYAVAHGFGMNLNWNCMLLIIFMLRRTLTLLRQTRMGPYLPVDPAVFAHKIIGYVVGICALGHFIMHIIHFRCLELEHIGNFTYNEFLFSTKPGLGWIPGAGIVSITGWPLLFAYFIIFCSSLPIIRRSGLFEIFFFTHLLYIPFMIILILHSDKFWKFIIVPGSIFIVEKLSMARCIRPLFSGEFYIKDVVLWQSGVTQLTMNHPTDFSFKAGDYMFVNIPSIAWFEWHPFTISSCPENLDSVTLHIRCAGQWTKRLHLFFKNHKQNCKGIKMFSFDGGVISWASPSSHQVATRNKPSVLYKKKSSVRGRTLTDLQLPIYVDGPYGTPSGKIFSAEHAVLICAGIGVTPFASILQSIMYRHQAEKAVACPQCHHVFRPEMAIMQSAASLKKVNFIWVVPNQRSIEWFLELLEELDAVQTMQNELNKLIDVQIFVTSATKMSDLHAFMLNTALDVFYKKHNKDMITGIRSRAIPGRPDWQKIFQNIDQNKCGQVSVFYCGPMVLGADLRRRSAEFNFEFCKESF